MLDSSGEMARCERPEAALERLNRELGAIRSCHQTLMRAVDEPSLLAEICRIVCEEAGYRMAWVGYVERDAEQSWRAVMPTVESVLTYSPESAKGHERPVGTLITGEADQQRGRETQCSAT